MGKFNRAFLVLLLAVFILIAAGAFFMGNGNTILVHASGEMTEAGSEEGEQETDLAEGEPEADLTEGEPEMGETVSGNGIEDISCICTDKCTSGRINAACAVCAEDYGKCAYISPKVRISILQPDKWYRYGNAEVRVSVEDAAHSPDFTVEKVEARIGQSGSYADITDSMKVRITEDCSVYVLVTDTNGKVYEENRSIQCFDKDKPSLNAGISGGMLTVQAMDRTSGVKAVYVNGQEFTDLTGGTVQIRLQQADSVYENFTVQAMDMAGNVSDIYTIKNPYYKNPEAKGEESSASELPVSALPTQPEKARAAVVDYVNTAEDMGGSMEEKAQPEKADGALPDTVSENDLLNVTGITYQVMEGDAAVVESAVPVSVEEQEPEDTKEEETEALDEPSPDDMEEKRSPALAYGVLALLIGIAAGGIYFFRSYRREGEDFIDEDDDEEEEIYENEDMENDGNDGDTGENEDMAEEDDFFYGEDE